VRALAQREREKKKYIIGGGKGKECCNILNAKKETSPEVKEAKKDHLCEI